MNTLDKRVLIIFEKPYLDTPSGQNIKLGLVLPKVYA